MRGGEKNPLQNLPAGRQEIENPFSLKKFEFVSLNLAPDEKLQQTFKIILPNLIHKSRKQNLK